MTTRSDDAPVPGARAPGLLRLALEARATLEFGVGLAALPLLRFAPKGDGHPVLVFPGFAASDLSTLLLRRFLRERGYAAHPWGLGRNLGPRPDTLARCLATIRTLRQRHRRKVSLIGWSLGGVYARELAELAPEDVRLVITLAAPFTGPAKATNAWRFYELINGRDHGQPLRRDAIRQPPPVPTTSIYSRSDGIVAWQCSVEVEGPLAENIEVEASHTGMGANPAVLYAIADRLALPEGRWAPFTRDGLRRHVYRDPQRVSRPAPAASPGR